MLDILRWAAAILILVTTFALLLSRDWRFTLAALAVQFLAVFTLYLAHWPLTMSAAKLVTGWMSAAILGITLSGRADFSPSQSSRLFKFFLALVVAGVAMQASSLVIDWIPSAGVSFVFAALLLIGQGILQLGMTVNPLRVTVGLLTALSGFELLSAPLDNSVLVAALLAATTLGIALTGAYLLTLHLEMPAQAEEIAE